MKIAWKIFVPVLLAVIMIAVSIIIYGFYQNGISSKETGLQPLSIKETVNVTPESNNVELLYFHRTERCESCNNAEQYIRDTLDKYYTEEMKSGQLSLQSIDYQKDREMAEKYNVKVQGLMIITTRNGQVNIKNIPEIWTYVNDRDAFMGFLRSVLDKELGK
jgi:hypothetical protein